MGRSTAIAPGKTMSISSRTPEGFPSHCPLCGLRTNIEFSDPRADAPCPGCGYLLLRSQQMLIRLQSSLAEMLGVSPDQFNLDASLYSSLGADSLDFVELVMELEEEFDLNIPHSKAEKMTTIKDLIRYLLDHEREGEL
jgi:acyl carrier protein